LWAHRFRIEKNDEVVVAYSSKTKIIVTIMFIVAVGGGFWLYAHGYVRFGKPPSENLAGTEITAENLQSAGHAHSVATTPSEKRILYWVDPMHPAYKSNKPGTAPDCGMDLVPVYDDGGDGRSSGENVPAGSIKIDPTKQQLIGVQLGQVEYGPVSKTIRAVARLAYDETKVTRMHTKVSGWIDKVFVDYTGQLVKKGQPLFTVYSPELVSTQEEFLIGLKAKQYLSDSQFKEVSSGAQGLYNAARRRLQLWDISDEQILELERTQKPLRDLTLYAPADGFVTKRNAFPKQQVNPDTEVYELADLSTVWVLADIYEYELPEIKLGQTTKINLTYFPGATFAGKVSYIYPELDNATRTAKVRIDLPNPDFKLKPDMYANAEFQINYGRQLTIPEEAVLDSGTKQIVFVAHGEGYFEPRQVALGAKLNNRYIVQSGLRNGETIVTSGNFLIDSESQLKASLGGMADMPGMDHSKQPIPQKKKKAEETR
jgi:Cu(I)/Ag(I) efflux system membrane fusion protein